MLISRSCVTILLAALPLIARADQTTEARALASQMIQQLGTALKKELAANGPDGVVSVCRDMAPAIAGELSRKSGGRVAQVSLKSRNPLLGDPDVWEQQVLAEFDRRAAAGEKVESPEYSETTEEPRGRYFRYMKALPVQPLCLTCHGTAKIIPDHVRTRLAIEYPRDRATGYGLGQVRGAVTIKQPAGTAQ
ncbi:MAG: DUF3365 domain-containing protein [Betaproteobacteria bacterium]|nr:DUF3365 domain-containing protein [Betaproteobacteria bacterium]